MTFEECRSDFEATTNRSISMPLAGAIVWFAIALLSTQLSERVGILALLLGSGVIFPLALVIAKWRGESLATSVNPFSKLMGLCVLMVNLLWAVHIPLVIYAPKFVPLSLGISLGLHWIVYSWIIQHPLGIIHAVVRTLLIVTVWFMFPNRTLLAVGLVIVAVYLITIWHMLNRRITDYPTKQARI